MSQSASRAHAGYLSRAADRFLEGLDYRSPADAVAAGARTAEQWCEEVRRSRAEAGIPEVPARGVEVHDPGDPAPGEVSAWGAAAD